MRSKLNHGNKELPISIEFTREEAKALQEKITTIATTFSKGEMCYVFDTLQYKLWLFLDKNKVE